MQNYINPAMVSKIDKLARDIRAQPILSECLPRKSDGIVFYHIMMLSDLRHIFVLGVNYKESYGFFISDKIELNDMVDLIHVEGDTFYMICNEEDSIKKINI